MPRSPADTGSAGQDLVPGDAARTGGCGWAAAARDAGVCSRRGAESQTQAPAPGTGTSLLQLPGRGDLPFGLSRHQPRTEHQEPERA